MGSDRARDSRLGARDPSPTPRARACLRSTMPEIRVGARPATRRLDRQVAPWPHRARAGAPAAPRSCRAPRKSSYRVSRSGDLRDVSRLRRAGFEQAREAVRPPPTSHAARTRSGAVVPSPEAPARKPRPPPRHAETSAAPAKPRAAPPARTRSIRCSRSQRTRRRPWPAAALPPGMPLTSSTNTAPSRDGSRSHLHSRADGRRGAQRHLFPRRGGIRTPHRPAARHVRAPLAGRSRALDRADHASTDHEHANVAAAVIHRALH